MHTCIEKTASMATPVFVDTGAHYALVIFFGLLAAVTARLELMTEILSCRSAEGLGCEADSRCGCAELVGRSCFTSTQPQIDVIRALRAILDESPLPIQLKQLRRHQGDVPGECPCFLTETWGIAAGIDRMPWCRKYRHHPSDGRGQP